MNEAAHAGALLSRLAASIGASIADGLLTMRYLDERRCTLCVDAEDGLLFLAPVASVRRFEETFLFEAALRLSADLDATGDGVIGFSHERRQLEFSQRLRTEGLEMESVERWLAESMQRSVDLASQLAPTSMRPASGPR